MHGISLSYPEGWTAQSGDRALDGSHVSPSTSVRPTPTCCTTRPDDHLFLTIASQPIGDATPEEWIAAQMASDEGCTATEPIDVDGAAGLIGAEGCDVAVVTTAGRGYWIQLYTSDDDPRAVAPYDRAWFEEVLATVQLLPEDAVDPEAVVLPVAGATPLTGRPRRPPGRSSRAWIEQTRLPGRSQLGIGAGSPWPMHGLPDGCRRSSQRGDPCPRLEEGSARCRRPWPLLVLVERLRLRRLELAHVVVRRRRGSPASTTGAGPRSEGGDLVITGRIVTMDDPPDRRGAPDRVGRRHLCRHARRGARGGSPRACAVVDIGSNVAYPGFIDAHAHWIGDRDYYGLDSAEAAMDAALSRGWTSISEQWVNPERLDELTALCLRRRPSDSRRRLSRPELRRPSSSATGTRRASPALSGTTSRVTGLKIHLDDGAGDVINWEPADLTRPSAGPTRPAGRYRCTR